MAVGVNYVVLLTASYNWTFRGTGGGDTTVLPVWENREVRRSETAPELLVSMGIQGPPLLIQTWIRGAPKERAILGPRCSLHESEQTLGIQHRGIPGIEHWPALGSLLMLAPWVPWI